VTLRRLRASRATQPAAAERALVGAVSLRLAAPATARAASGAGALLEALLAQNDLECVSGFYGRAFCVLAHRAELELVVEVLAKEA
jgi:hypothetical protein